MNHLNTFKTFFDQCVFVKKKKYLLGELNDNYSGINSKLRNIIATTRPSQLVETPTRVTTNSTTLLDAIITNTPNTVIASEVTPCPIVDHDLISATLAAALITFGKYAHL